MWRLIILFHILSIVAAASAAEVCIYAGPDGTVKQVNSRQDVPAASRATAQCFSPKNSPYLAKPEEIQLSGNTRRESLNSSVGTINLRWPRKIESLFGRTPLRAMTDAAQTVSKALRKGAVPSNLQKLNLTWQVVFLDQDLPETQIPSYLISNCHPGWMTPPANIYIVGQRVAGGCGGQKVTAGVADSTLTEVLIHEMGHAIEYALLEGRSNPEERMRKEGFATWFESYAADSSSIISRGEIDRKLKAGATKSIQLSPTFNFQGTAEDYARAAMFLRTVENKRGANGVFEVYNSVGKGLPLLPAIQDAVGWNPQTVDGEVRKFLKIPNSR